VATLFRSVGEAIPVALATSIAHRGPMAAGTLIGRAFATPAEIPFSSDAMRAIPWDAVFAEATRHLEQADREMAAAARCGARVIDVEDDEYPPALRAIEDAPPVLFVLGRMLPVDRRAIAVVGSRKATSYGMSVVRRFVPEISGHGVTIVSGMAYGIDAAAHRSALRAGGRTIAVLGTGIDVCYPPDSRDLYRDIPERGAIVSEAAPGTPPLPHVFPVRNRIITGLSKGTLVIEARARSGTLITGRCALDQGRDLYAVPGDVDSGRSDGTNAMLEFGTAASTAGHVIRGSFDPLYMHPDVRGVRTAEARDASQEKLLACMIDAPQAIDSLQARTGLPVPRLLAALSGLERAGLASRDGSGRYARFVNRTSSE
jgi:DNA processing protein